MLHVHFAVILNLRHRIVVNLDKLHFVLVCQMFSLYLPKDKSFERGLGDARHFLTPVAYNFIYQQALTTAHQTINCSSSHLS